MPSRLGQNFLKDHKALERIAEVVEISKEDIVVEIGPGHGELTRRLLKYGPKKLIGVELDENLIKTFLVDLSQENESLTIVNSDIKTYLPKIKEKDYKLVGNIPYYLTSHLLRIISELQNKPSLIVLTVQKEVAERICATPPKMNLLAASVLYWGSPEIVRYISKNSFRPSPKVDSAIIKIIPAPRDMDEKRYFRLIKAIFSSPRKTLGNNLKGFGVKKEEIEKILEKIGLDGKSRPQDLTIDHIETILSSIK